MSHEIRTPLNGILAVGQMLAETTLSGERVRELLAAHPAAAGREDEGLLPEAGPAATAPLVLS
jgi:signal transduction histidine kinase